MCLKGVLGPKSPSAVLSYLKVSFLLLTKTCENRRDQIQRIRLSKDNIRGRAGSLTTGGNHKIFSLAGSGLTLKLYNSDSPKNPK
jgi:hypothetical protein